MLYSLMCTFFFTAFCFFFVTADRLQPKLILTRAGPRLQIMFPTHIPGEFEIMAYYNYQHHFSSELISHPDFRNTQEVNIAIPSNKLPSFKTFSVRVALSVANKTGGASITSNQISEWSATCKSVHGFLNDVWLQVLFSQSHMRIHSHALFVHCTYTISHSYMF